MNVKLLLDEKISPWVADRLCKEDGIDACGIRDRGLLAASDPEVLEYAFTEDRILVTKNVDDFDKLARSRDLHAGIEPHPRGIQPPALYAFRKRSSGDTSNRQRIVGRSPNERPVPCRPSPRDILGS